MITKEQAASLKPGQVIYNAAHKNADQSPLRARVNGKIKFWKSRPSEFEVPLKLGLKTFLYLNEGNAKHWCLTEDEAKKGVKS